jgi:hypothetical protein
MAEATDWDQEFERLVRLLDVMPAALLEGLLCHVTKSLYGRGIFGTSSAEGCGPKHNRTLINGAVSRTVQHVERDLREGREVGATGYSPREPVVYRDHVTSRRHR